jgi:nucleotide-binding universal stress UspA family protein
MYKRVLVPLDGSPLAEGILPFLMEIAAPLDMAVVLLRVLEPVAPVAVEGTQHFMDDLAVRREDAQRYLARIAAGLRARGVNAQCEVREGRPEEVILAAAQKIGADLIAMSTHGRSGLGRLLFGSVAEQVLRHAAVPVFLMRQGKPRPALPTPETLRR